MNFIKRIFKNIKSKSIRIFRTSSINGFEESFDSANLGSFKDSLYLFIGVSMIRETISSIELEMYKILNQDGEVEEIEDDPYLDLLARPNYQQSYKEFMKLATAYYLLAGETFWYLVRTDINNPVPESIVNMRPDHVQILLSPSGDEIIGYEFSQGNGEILKIRKEDVLHIKNIDPLNPLRGVGVVRPARSRIVTEQEASEYQSKTFKTRGRPDTAVFTSVDVTDESSAEARKRWNKVYNGDNASSVGFFGDEVKDIKILSASPKEMDFTLSMNFLRDDILASLRIPKAMITSDDVNLANSKTARTNYLKEACMPVLDAFIDVMNHKLLDDSTGEQRFFRYESPVQEDREIILKETTELKTAGIITVNEARALMNYPDIEGGDTLSDSSFAFSLKRKMATVRSEARKVLSKRGVLKKKLSAIKAVTNYVLEQEKSVPRQMNSVFNTPESKSMYIKAWNESIDNKSKSFKEHIDIYNDGLVRRIKTNFEKFGVSTQNIFDVSTEVNTAKGIFNPLMKSIFEKSAKDTMESIASGFAKKSAENFFTPEMILQELEQRAEFFILSMLDTDWKQLKEIIADSLENGKGVEEIGRDIRRYFDDMSVARARTIARTETGRVVSLATNEAYKQSEFVTGKEWMTANDDKVRDAHRENAGKIVATGGTFPSGEEYPGQYSINCRCALAPAI